MEFRTPASTAPPAAEGSAADRFDRAAAFLRSAGTSAVRAAGSLAGAPQVGGVNEVGGELQGAQMFRSFGSVVNINPGGFFGEGGGETFLGDAGIGHQGTGTGDGSPTGSVTILGSGGSMTLRSSSASLGRVDDRNSPSFQRLPTRQETRAPAWLDSGLTNVSLGGYSSERPPKASRRKSEKTFHLLLIDLQEVRDGGDNAICCGVVGEGSRFCSKLSRDCAIRDHSKRKMYSALEMEDGYYINDLGSGRAFGEPCLPLGATLRSPTFSDLLTDGEGKTLETWTTIFRHLSDRAKDAEAASPTSPRGGRMMTMDEEDRGLAKFYTALKAPGRVALDTLNSPKRMKFDDVGMEDGEDDVGEGSVVFGPLLAAATDARFDHLRTSLALVKGELGSRATEAPYATIHGGLQGALTALATFESRLDSKASSGRVDSLVAGTNACYDKSAEACRAVEQLVTLGSISKVAALEHEMREMTARTRVLEATLDKASQLVEDLSAYVSTMPRLGTGGGSPGKGVAAEEFLAFKASQEHALASMRQELKGGGISLGGFEFDGKESCIAFAREHLTGDLTYHCIPSLMYALCMTSEEVVYKSDMQSDEIHAARTSRNPMQSAVVLSVNTIIPPVLEGKKDGIRELKHDFNAAKTYEEWLPQNSHGGTCRNLQGGVKRAFERIKGAISQSIGSRLALTILTELHGECMMHFSAIFVTEVDGFYRDILGKSGAPPQSAASKASCWSLVTKLLRVLFKEICRS